MIKTMMDNMIEEYNNYYKLNNYIKENAVYELMICSR